MKRLGGRPHWGKNYTITRDEALQVYPPTYTLLCVCGTRSTPTECLRTRC